MRYTLESKPQYYSFRMIENESLEGSSLDGIPSTFTEQLKNFVEAMFTVDKLATLHDIVRDPAEYQRLTELKKSLDAKSFKDWDEAVDLPLFQETNAKLKALEQQSRYNRITFTIRPYSHHLDIVCLEIFHALKKIETKLNEKGVTVPDKTYDNLKRGASHEAFHYLRYIATSGDNKGPTVRSRLHHLLTGNPRLGEWQHYSTEMIFVLVDGKLEFEMTCNVPHGWGMVEQVQILLAPAEPSLGDALLAAKEIITWGNHNHPLYKEISELIVDALEEAITRDDITSEENRAMILKAIKDMDSHWYFNNVMYPRLKPLGDAFTKQILTTITRYIPKDFGITPY